MVLFGLAIAAVPAVPAFITRGANSGAASSEETTEPSETEAPENDESIKLLDVSTGEVMTLSMRDYVIGAVCAEMPASFEEEALKAQAVAVHTYAVRQQELQAESPTPELQGADLSNDSSHYQAYFTKSQAMQFYGTGFDTAYAKITSAVEEVLSYILTYDDEPVIAAFCSMSSGTTESEENVWGQAVPYLVPADSKADESAPNFLDETVFTKSELREKLETAFPDGDFSSPAKEWIETEEVSDSGTVLTAKAGGENVTGQQLRTALDLRSAAFEIEWDGDSCTITTKGCGHGVGMSQYGADAMAKGGADWRDILLHYYKGAEIVKK